MHAERQHDEHEQAEPVVVELTLEVDAQGAEPGDLQRGRAPDHLHQPALAVEPGLGGDRERKRGDREEQPAHPQRGHADHQRGHAAGRERVEDAHPRGVAELVQPAAHEGAESDEGELPQRHLAREPGEHDQRQQHGREQHDARQEHPVGVAHRQWEHEGEDDDDHEPRGAGPADPRQPVEHRVERAERARQRPRAPLAAPQHLTEAAAEQQRGEDHHEQHQLERPAGGPVPAHDRLDEADDDTAGEHLRQARHPPDRRRRQRPHHQRRPEGDAGDDRLRRADEDGRHAREQAGHRPHDERDAPHRDAGEVGGVAVLGRGPAGEPDARRAEEHGECDGHDRDDQEDEQLARGEAERSDVEAGVERRRECGPSQPPPPGNKRVEGEEELRRADGGDHEDEARPAPQLPDHHQLGERAGRGRDQQRHE